LFVFIVRPPLCIVKLQSDQNPNRAAQQLILQTLAILATYDMDYHKYSLV